MQYPEMNIEMEIKRERSHFLNLEMTRIEFTGIPANIAVTNPNGSTTLAAQRGTYLPKRFVRWILNEFAKSPGVEHVDSDGLFPNPEDYAMKISLIVWPDYSQSILTIISNCLNDWQLDLVKGKQSGT